MGRDRLAEIEEYTQDPEAYKWVDPMDDIDWLIEEVKRLRVQVLNLTNQLYRLGYTPEG
jgi:hypothetical protein